MTGSNGQSATGFEREAHDHYVEPAWCVELLIQAENLPGTIWDPCCGFGTIPETISNFRMSDKGVFATDLIDRGYNSLICTMDFLSEEARTFGDIDHIIMNSPFKYAEAFVDRALQIANYSVCSLLPLKWLSSRSRKIRFENDWPLARVHVLSNRPSMLPGWKLKAGEKPGGGAVDYAWFVFEHGHRGLPQLNWLATPGRASSSRGGSRPAAAQALQRKVAS